MLAFLKPQTGQLVAFDTLCAVPRKLPDSFGSIQDAATLPARGVDARSGPHLALLTRAANAEHSTFVLVHPDLSATLKPLDGRYGRIELAGDLAVLLPTPRAADLAVDAAGGANGQDDAGSSVAILEQASGSGFEVSGLPVDGLSIVAVAKPTLAPSKSWIAAASATSLVLVAASRQAGGLMLDASYTVDLSGRHVGATRPPKLLFDAAASRLFIWTTGASEVLWLDLAATDSSTNLPLATAHFETAPTDVQLAFASDHEVLLGVAPASDGGATVGIIDLASWQVGSANTPVAADSLLVLPQSSNKPSPVLLYSRAPANRQIEVLGLSDAQRLASRIDVGTERPEPITPLPLRAAYRLLTPLSDTVMLLQNQDGGATVYNVADATTTSVSGWVPGASFVGTGSFIGRRFFSKQALGGGRYRIRAFSKLAADGAFDEFVAPGDVAGLFELGESAYAFMHPGTLGLLTYYQPRGVHPESYTAVGFLTAELAQ